MMISIVEKLVRQISPPQTTFKPKAEDWLDVEKKLNLSLPEDYKTIIDIYGDFKWMDFLYLLNPFSSNKYLNLFNQLEITLDAERETRKLTPEYYPLPLYPEINGLLPFFVTDNGDIGFWITYLQPEKWSILLRPARSFEFEVHFESTAGFLYQYTGGRFQSLVLPKIVL